MIRTWITDAPLEIAKVMAAVGTAADGAVLVFAGTVRNHNDGRLVTGMRYDAYAGMAARVLDEIAHEAAGRWDVSSLAAAHRTGELLTGDVSVAIAVSSPHRTEAFDAGRYVIEEIKRRLPVWKQERYADATERWLEGVTPPAAEPAQ
jgi:molybdopterin synthase catalytic subunit